MKQKNRSVINIGTTSLVLVFAVLALVTFALLSYTSARAQWKMAEKMAERMTQYYEGEQLAAEKIEQILAADTGTGEIVEFQIPIGEKQQLQVKVQASGEENKKDWKILQWQLELNGEEQEQQNLTLYGSAICRRLHKM